MRYWTVEEARGYLDQARELLEAVRRASPPSSARGNGHGAVGAAKRETVTRAANEAAAKLRANSIIVRDLSIGLVDFPAIGHDGVEYLICWMTSEADVGWWHSPEEGIAGRKPLPRRSGGGTPSS